MRAFPLSLLLSLIGTAVPLTAFAENGKYFPIDHREIGAAARANVKINPGLYGYFQPIRVELPTTGEVTFFDGTLRRGSSSEAPAQAGMMVGHVYRVKIAHMPEFPNVELYPTLEIIDRLHPPPGLAARFPIPVNITVEEIETALHDQMVTKVIYLEQPDFAAAEDKLSDRVQVVPPNETCWLPRIDWGVQWRFCGWGGGLPIHALRKMITTVTVLQCV